MGARLSALHDRRRRQRAEDALLKPARPLPPEVDRRKVLALILARQLAPCVPLSGDGRSSCSGSGGGGSGDAAAVMIAGATEAQAKGGGGARATDGGGAASSPPARPCPICMSLVPMNVTVCCRQGICTECFVLCHCASRPPGAGRCPYCRCEELNVEVRDAGAGWELRPKGGAQREWERTATTRQAQQRLKLKPPTPLPTVTLTLTLAPSAHMQQTQYPLPPPGSGGDDDGLPGRDQRRGGGGSGASAAAEPIAAAAADDEHRVNK